MMAAVGVPVTKKEREGRAGKNEGQPARTREVKLDCFFTQTDTGGDCWPIRDPDSTSYVAAIEPAEDFSLRLYTEAWRRGWSKARRKVVLGDGASWMWNLADLHFPGAIQIADPITPASTSGNWPPGSLPATSGRANGGRPSVLTGSMPARSKRW